MRNAIAKSLTEMAKNDPDITLFYADIGNRLFNNLKEIAPQRTINAGIAEANMASMAAGAAMMGLKPFIYTITPFTTARKFEQIKVDIAYQNQPVIIVGTGSGLSYANLGPTHHSFEDIALMRSLPNMNIICPADAYELEMLLPQALELSQPCYFRIGKKNEPEMYEKKQIITFGKVSVLKTGKAVAILCAGTILSLGKELLVALRKINIEAELVSFHTVKPLDDQYLNEACERFEHIITLEEHNVAGGFGSAVLEWLNDRQQLTRLHRFGIPDKFIDQVASQKSAQNKVGLSIEKIMPILSERLRK